MPPGTTVWRAIADAACPRASGRLAYSPGAPTGVRGQRHRGPAVRRGQRNQHELHPAASPLQAPAPASGPRPVPSSPGGRPRVLVVRRRGHPGRSTAMTRTRWSSATVREVGSRLQNFARFPRNCCSDITSISPAAVRLYGVIQQYARVGNAFQGAKGGWKARRIGQTVASKAGSELGLGGSGAPEAQDRAGHPPADGETEPNTNYHRPKPTGLVTRAPQARSHHGPGTVS